MELLQSNRSSKHTFSLKQDSFIYAFSGKLGSGEFTVNYADLPKQRDTRSEKHIWLVGIGCLWVLIGLLELGYAHFFEHSLQGKGLWLALGVGCLLCAQLFRAKSTVYNTEQGEVVVLHDGQHKQLLNELDKRKREQMRDWYGQINFNNGIEQEINKFRWLLEEKVLTKREVEQKIAALEINRHNEDPMPAELLN